MAPFNVLIKEVPDDNLAGLLSEIARAGFTHPVVMPASPASDAVLTPPALPAVVDLPDDWRIVGQREEISYAWPEETDEYDRYRIFAGATTSERRDADSIKLTVRTSHVSLGETFSLRWGSLRRRAVAFLTTGAPQQPLCEFVAADDYDSTRELLSVIRGRGGTAQMYGPGDTLPDVYQERFVTALYSERVRYPGVWSKHVVVVHEDDYPAMLNHALIQGWRREATRAAAGGRAKRGSTIKGRTSDEFDGITVPTLREWERYWMDPARHQNDPAITPERPVGKHLELIRAELRARGK